MSSLTITGVTKRFGQTVAVDDVTLHVPHGSFTTVLGPSGCGKTTLLRLIAGFLAPESGSISFGDTVVAGDGVRPMPPQSRKVGYVPQEGALFPHLDVAANISFGLGKGARGADRVAEMLDLVELPADSPSDPQVAEFVGRAVVLPGTADAARATCALGTVVLTEPTEGEVSLMIRPEQVFVDMSHDEGVRATVEEVSYYGHDCAVQVRLDDGTSVLSRMSGVLHPVPGDTVHLRVTGLVRAYRPAGTA